MEGTYEYYKDYCVCPVARVFVLMKDLNGNEVYRYPVEVYNVNEVLIGEASTKAQFIAVWNSDPDNQEVGTLISALGPFSFRLIVNPGQTAPDYVIGVPTAGGVGFGIIGSTFIVG